MQRRILFIITSDPRVSPRPAEAVRIAAGVGAWEQPEVTIYLRDAAVLAMGEFAEELVDGDDFARFLPIAAHSGRQICAQRDSPLLAELGRTITEFLPVDDEQLARLAAGSDFVLRF